MTHNKDGCPSQEKLLKFYLGEDDRESSSPDVEHVEHCPTCKAIIDKHLANACRQLNNDYPFLHVTSQRDSPQPSFQPPRIPGYVILDQLGSGGLGVVYRARQESVGRVVALKVLRQGVLSSEKGQSLFQRESKALGQLNHSNVVHVYDTGTVEGLPYFSMELVEGLTLAECLKTSGPLPCRQAAEMVSVVAHAVAAAHSCGILHCDLKPSNVLLSSQAGRFDDLRVADFGLARWIDPQTGGNTTGFMGGTAPYMAPEQLHRQAGRLGVGVDIYALGVVLYECLTGRTPFLGNEAEIILQVQTEEVIPPRRLRPDLPRDLETVCLKCLEKSPQARYTTAQELQDDLDRWLRGEPVRARRVGLYGRTVRLARRHPVAAGLTAALALVFLVGMTGILYQWHQADVSRREAQASDAQSYALLKELLPTSPDSPHYLRITQRLPSFDALKRAETHFADLLQQRPNDFQCRVALTNIRGALAQYLGLNGRLDEMTAHFHAAHSLWSDLVREDPNNSAYLDWLATTAFWLSDGAYKTNQPESILQYCLTAVTCRRQLHRRYPENLNHLDQLFGYRKHWLEQRRPSPHTTERIECLLQHKRRLERETTESREGAQADLADVCLLLGEIQPSTQEKEARDFWLQALDHYRSLNRSEPPTVLSLLDQALCCCRLQSKSPADTLYLESRKTLARAINELNRLRQKGPRAEWVRAALLEGACLLLLCDCKANADDRDVKTSMTQIRSLVTDSPENGAETSIALVEYLTETATHLLTSNRDVAQRLAKQAAVLVEQCADAPERNLDLTRSIVTCALNLSVQFRRLGLPADSLRLAELYHRLSAGMFRAYPRFPPFGNARADALTMIGKARWELGQRDAAIIAFREAIVVQQKVIDLAPNDPFQRLVLSRSYDRLVHWGNMYGAHEEVFQALLKQEKLWPGDEQRLMETAATFEKLSRLIGKEKKQLTKTEASWRARYQAEGKRIRAAVRSGK